MMNLSGADDRPKLSTRARVIGYACPNDACARYQAIVFTGWQCFYCGTVLRKASASVAVFRWEPMQDPG